MPDQLLDIHLDVDPTRLPLDRKAATRVVYEAARHGRTLRYTDPRETVIKAAQDPITGDDVLLVSTRWLTD